MASDNLGVLPGLTAGAALLIDYVLTVSVSVAAGVAAVTSAVPALDPHREGLGLVAIALVVAANLRGVRESGRIFAVPTYGFIACVALLIGWGALRLALGGDVHTVHMPHQATNPITAFLLMRAFALGCSALTGVEAISNGVPAFQPPEARNARTTLIWMGLILGGMFAGITWLADQYAIVPSEDETVLSQIGGGFSGSAPCTTRPRPSRRSSSSWRPIRPSPTSRGWPVCWPGMDSCHASSRTAATGWCSPTERHPRAGGARRRAHRGLPGEVNALIPLYAVGVFLSFTLSQAGMIRHWQRERHPGWWGHALVNGVGALTVLVTAIIAITKFTEGAWLVVLLIPLLVLGFWRIRRHYNQVARNLSLEGWTRTPMRTHRVIVPIGGVHRATLRAIDYARQLGPDVTAVYVDSAGDDTRILAAWAQWGDGVPLVVLTSPFRSLVRPLLDYIGGLQAQQGPDGFVTVVLPEFVPSRWWHHFLHNQSALLLKGALLFRRDVIVVDVPFHLPS